MVSRHIRKRAICLGLNKVEGQTIHKKNAWVFPHSMILYTWRNSLYFVYDEFITNIFSVYKEHSYLEKGVSDFLFRP